LLCKIPEDGDDAETLGAKELKNALIVKLCICCYYQSLNV